ncbi:MAG: CapA family protein, partial [Veillonellaceae bacterium]|nr:CapA family protein [Veillonellaceae bacterium]
GALRTMDVLREAGLDTTGTFKSAEESKAFLIKDIRGIKVGYLAYSYGTNGMPIPTGKEYFYNFLQKDRVLADIETLRPQVDVLMLVLHWGVEYSDLPTAEQRELARLFFEKGADIILGSHPHVLQPLEIMHVNGKEKLVIYSMGNSMGDQNGLERNSGVIISLQFTKNNKTGETNLSSYNYIPTYIHEYYDQGRRRFRLLAVEEAINAVKTGREPFLGSDKLPMLEQIWSDIDYRITQPLP